MKARDLALATLDEIELPNWPAGVARFPPHLPRQANHPEDSELSQRIRIGVIENLLRINHIVELYANRPLKKIDPLVLKIIGIAMYQLLYLDRIPPAAAVDEAVKQAKAQNRISATGFVNAVLRRATREKPPALPDPAKFPREYARLACSHPVELFDRLEKLLGTEQALQFCRHSNLAPPTILRLLPGATKDQLHVGDVSIFPHRTPGFFIIKPTPHALLRQWSFDGIAQAQDITSAQVVEHCDIQPGMNVLDRCAGRGTKTMQLAEKLNGKGKVIAIDSDRGKLKGLEDVIRHRRLSNVYWCCGKETDCADVRSMLPRDGFDRVLIDAPCSNSGVLARRAAARYSQTDAAIDSLRELQRYIIRDTVGFLKPGGLLIYSTCSVWPEENGEISKWVMQTFPNLTHLNECTTLPSIESEDPLDYHDGGYVSVFRRES
jgi:16S rRNA (cytosine967-C5)-methyltransferase